MTRASKSTRFLKVNISCAGRLLKSVRIPTTAIEPCVSESGVVGKSGEQSKRDGVKTELRPGIGACDDCGEERWPQQYAGYGMMVCLDCFTPKEGEICNE